MRYTGFIMPTMKYHLSFSLIAAAKVQADLAAKTETDFINLITAATEKQPSVHSPISESKGYTMAAVMLAAAGVEASINEFYDDSTMWEDGLLVDNHEVVSACDVRVLKALWDIGQQRFNTLEKFQLALDACQLERFNSKTEPLFSSACLFQLRNALLHYKPEWDNALRKHKSIRQNLEGLFPVNQIVEVATRNRPWFPDSCLGAGCAKWAIESAIELHQAFYIKLGLPPHLE